MTDHSPITPPSDQQVGEWLCDDGYPWDPSEQVTITITTNRLKNVATQAARWGADQELEACCAWLEQLQPQGDVLVTRLRTVRRPEPLSLKEQALEEFEAIRGDLYLAGIGFDAPAIRLALEQLDD